ncbi:hypothetical protein PV11_07877 [Exophiala sideris]|uniref:RRM domain-containing protein n=1 Tax=Exophiala sideris TaxID=1016849 RepID=A0A0D1WYZ0_9EURO|nr:hypothetical protein PV11_07877 [Exophiala sideris]
MAKKRKADQIESETVAEPSQAVAKTKKTSTKSASQDADAQKPVKKSKGQSRQDRSERRSTKKRKTKEHSSADVQEADGAENLDNSVETTADDGNGGAEVSQPTEEKSATKKKPKKEKQPADKEKPKAEARFIVFVGNLPYDVTTDQIRQHFIKIAPSSVRLTTDKNTGRSKGFAFLEFDAYDKMKTCLKLYHHSEFNPQSKDGEEDGHEPAQDERKRGRKINVELTAGGGGKSKDRKAKIKTKNEKLEEERARQRTKEKAEKENTAHKKKAGRGTGANASGANEASSEDHGAIHPSRLLQMRH